MKKGCSVKFMTQEIIVTNKFLKAAEVVGSEEYEILLKVRRDFPNFQICKRPYHNYRYYRAA